MRVFYDHYIFSYQRYGGVSKYICELLRNIPKKEWECSAFISNNQYLKDYGLYKHIPFLPKLSFKGQERLIAEINYIYTKYLMGTTNWDVFHATGHDSRLFNDVKDKPIVITAHDLLYELYHENDPRKELVVSIEKLSAQKANKVIAISENTKADLINYWGIEEEKIQVIYHGIEKTKFNISEKRIFIEPYVLYVGARKDYKNFTLFLKAFALVSSKNKDIKLVCTGLPFSKEENVLIRDLCITNKVFQIAASEMQMAQLYSDAELFVYPSLYEGFGMPILEAMVYNCPIVISNSSCFPEIAQDAALYFDPLQIDDIVDKISNLLLSKELRNQLQIAAKKRLEYFSWRKCADEHMELYKNLV